MKINLIKKEMLVYSSATKTINFSEKRPQTLIGGTKQGEHCTTYALFVEFVMAESNRAIKANAKSTETHVTELVSEIFLVVNQCKSLLYRFGLTESDDEKNAYQEFQSVFDEMNGLKISADTKLIDIYNVKEVTLNAINHWGTLDKDAQENSVPLLNAANLTIEFLNSQIREIESEYFINLAVCLSNAYFKYQNKADYVTFEKIDGHMAGGEQGGHVKGALAYLRQYIEIEPLIRSKDEIEDECMNNLYKTPNKPKTRSAIDAISAFELNAKKYVNTLWAKEKDELINDIVESIQDLLFYPKINNEKLEDPNDATYPTLVRTNSINVLKYVTARHLILIFKTFNGLAKNDFIKNEISEKYINIIMSEWEIKEADKENFKRDVMNALENDGNLKVESLETPIKININPSKLSLTKASQDNSNTSSDIYTDLPVRPLLFIDQSPNRSASKSATSSTESPFMLDYNSGTNYAEQDCSSDEDNELQKDMVASLSSAPELLHAAANDAARGQNQAAKFFTAHTDEYKSHLDFETWYHPDICNYLLCTAKNNAGLVPIMMQDGKEFAEQLQSLKAICSKIEKNGFFIIKEPGSQNHYICGLLVGNKLLLINPLGLTKHKGFYQEVGPAAQHNKLQVFLSTQKIQKMDFEVPGIVSCGAIVSELAINILSLDEGALTGVFNGINPSDAKENECLKYYDLYDLLEIAPSSLSQLLQDEGAETYKDKVTEIRKSHLSRLENIKFQNRGNNLEDINKYLQGLKEGTKAQNLFNKLMTVGLGSVDEKDYGELLEELSVSVPESKKLRGEQVNNTEPVANGQWSPNSSVVNQNQASDTPPPAKVMRLEA